MDYVKLNESLKDEYADVVKYVDFYKETDNGVFRDIAREEFVHAKHLKHILTSSGNLENVTEAEEKAKAALESV